MSTSSLPEWFTDDVRECIHRIQPSLRSQTYVAQRLRGAGFFEAGDAIYAISSTEYGRIMWASYLSTSTKNVRW